MVDFKIALYGQLDSDTKFGFTYPDAFNPMRVTTKDEWLRSVSDPRDARVFTDSTVYAIWKNEHGNYYAIIVPNSHDTRNGYLILTLFTGYNRPKSGSTILTMLSDLKQLIIDQGVRDNHQIADYLSKTEHLFIRDNVPAPNGPKDVQKAYRPFENEAELCDLFENLNQEAYAPYRRILLAPSASVPSQLGTNYVKINTPIVHTYTIKLPGDGTRTGKATVMDGEELDITYSKQGYEPEIFTVRVDGTPSRYFTIDGKSLLIKSAVDAGISFMRGIVVNVNSINGVSVPEFVFNGALVHNGAKVKLPDQQEYTFTIAANGYETHMVKKRISELTSPMRFTLQPRDISMPVTMNYQNKAIRGHVVVSADDPLYKYFKNNHDYQFVIKGGSSKTQGGSFLKKYLWQLISLFLLVAIILMWQCSQDKEANPAIQQSTVLTTKTDSVVKKDKDSASKKDKEAIENYLKKGEKLGDREVWRLDSLKDMEEYAKVFEFIKNNDIEALVNWSYNNASDDHLNGLWKSIFMNLKTLKNCGATFDDISSYVISEGQVFRLQDFCEHIKIIKSRFSPTGNL